MKRHRERDAEERDSAKKRREADAERKWDERNELDYGGDDSGLEGSVSDDEVGSDVDENSVEDVRKLRGLVGVLRHRKREKQNRITELEKEVSRLMEENEKLRKRHTLGDLKNGRMFTAVTVTCIFLIRCAGVGCESAATLFSRLVFALTGYQLAPITPATIGLWSGLFSELSTRRLLKMFKPCIKQPVVVLCQDASAAKNGYTFSVVNISAPHPKLKGRVIQGTLMTDLVHRGTGSVKGEQLLRAVELLGYFGNVTTALMADHEASQSAAARKATLKQLYCLHHKFKNAIEAGITILQNHAKKTS